MPWILILKSLLMSVYVIASMAALTIMVVLMAMAAFAQYLTYKFIAFVGFDMYHAIGSEQDAKQALNRPIPVPGKTTGGGAEPKKILDGAGSSGSGGGSAGSGGGSAPSTPKATPATSASGGAAASGGASGGAAASARGGGVSRKPLARARIVTPRTISVLTEPRKRPVAAASPRPIAGVSQ